MPAILDDPASATIYRVSGDPPFPDPTCPAVPPSILPRNVTLRDRQTVATVVPFASRHEVPESLLRYLSDQFNKEIEGGDTYPMLEPMPFAKFADYWFQNFGGIMLLGHIESAAEVVEGKDWSKECLGTFYIKPNYPGRSSHICNAGFIVTDASRNRGVGRLMGETYLEWAPKLGYKYSVFNLVYETNVASCKIWDALGFKRIGRVKGAGNLKSHPDRLVDAIIYGRDLGDAAGGAGNEELVSEERFDKIKFYLKYGRYPNGADRAEKSRLRSAATHYKLLDGDVLMLKDKEVISDPQRQYEIARNVHNQTHGGINKTTATIAERYHWSRIKETVSDVIRNCSECKDTNKASSQNQQPSPGVGSNGLKRPHPSAAASASACKRASPSPSAPGAGIDFTDGAQRPPVADPSHISPFNVPTHQQYADPSAISILPPPDHHPLPSPTDTAMTGHDALSREAHNPLLQPLHPHHHPPTTHPVPLQHTIPVPDYQPIDPQIIAQSSTSSDLHHHSHAHDHTHHHHYSFSHPSPPHPQHHHHHQHQHSHTHHDPDPDADAETFQALLNAAVTDDDEEEANNNQLAVGVSSAPPGLSAEMGDDRERGGNIPSPGGPAHHDGISNDHQHHHHHHHHHNHQPLEHPISQQRERTKAEQEKEDEAVDRDLEMLIESQEDDEPLSPEHDPGSETAVKGGGKDVLDVEMNIGGGGDAATVAAASDPATASSGRMDVTGLLADDDTNAEVE